jgi:hypothetical protein
VIQILHRDVAQGSRAAAQLLDEIMAYPGLSAEWRLPRQVVGVVTGHDDAPRQGRLSSRLLLHLYDAGDADGRALQQIKIECFFPADDATAAKARQLAL